MQDFGELSEPDFVQLMGDLLGAEWKMRLHRFPRGRDGGVDLQGFGPTAAPLHLAEASELVVQCKHRPRDVLRDLRRELAREAQKDIVKQADRYILVTSARLTRANKREIASNIYGGGISENDVLGREDVDDLLRNHPEVLRTNMKMFLASGSHLQVFLNQAEHINSAEFSRRLLQLQRTFVETDVVKQALAMLESSRICILSGPPGVGKTTTASILLLRYMAEGWQPVVATSEVRELEVQFLPGVKQVLFFDDFLGQAGKEAILGRGEDSSLVRLMRAVERDPNRVLILTTRDYRLKKAQQAYEQLSYPVFESSRLTVRLDGLSEDDRVHILRNQLHYSPMGALVDESIDLAGRFTEIVRHRNYNPRVIEMTIEAEVRCSGFKSVGPRESGWDCGAESSITGNPHLDMFKVLEDALESPAKLWRHILWEQLSTLQLEILISRLSFGDQAVFLSDLIKAASALAKSAGRDPDSMDMERAIRILENDLIQLDDTYDSPEVAIARRLHPGVPDALWQLIGSHPDFLFRLVDSAQYFEQIEFLETCMELLPADASSERIAYMGKLADGAARTFLSPFTGLVTEFERIDEKTLVPVRSVRLPRYYHLGQRLLLVSKLYSVAGRAITSSFAGKIMPTILDELKNLHPSEIWKIFVALGRWPNLVWRPWQLQLDTMALHELDMRNDIESWVALLDILLCIEGTTGVPEDYRNHLIGQLKSKVSDFLSYANHTLTAGAYDPDFGMPHELVKLSELCSQFGLLSDLPEDLEATAKKIEDAMKSRSQPGITLTSDDHLKIVDNLRTQSVFDE